MELAEESSDERLAAKEPRKPEPEAKPWERDADWWKQ